MSAVDMTGWQPRQLACVQCQRRKVKCDRNSPCSNCIKADVECSPGVVASQRKRRAPNSDLKDRLARCEELLNLCAPSSAPPTKESDSKPQTAPDQGKPHISLAPTKANPPAGAPVIMLNSDGRERYFERPIAVSLHEQMQTMRTILGVGGLPFSAAIGSENFPFDSDSSTSTDSAQSTYMATISELQPGALETFDLWQLFVDRINPLTKIIHIPTVQPYITEAAISMNSVSIPCQALLFAIYSMAVVSLADDEYATMFDVPREETLQRFNLGTRKALSRYDYLRNFDMVTVQTMLLHLFSLETRLDPFSVWIACCTTLRMAVKLGYHRDGAVLGLGPFETEMRRRIWSQVMIQDSKNSMLSGLNASSLNFEWDTKPVQNVNDEDLIPGSMTPVPPRDEATEMAFCLVMQEVYRYRIEVERDDDSQAIEAAMVGLTLDDDPQGSEKAAFEKFRSQSRELDDRIRRVEDHLIDRSAGGAHAAALAIRAMVTEHVDDIVAPIREQAEWGTEIFTWKDNLFKLLTCSTERQCDAHDRMTACGFGWYMRLQFFPDFISAITAQLYQRPFGTLSDRGWRVVEKLYGQHSRELYDLSRRQSAVQAQFSLKAWEVRREDAIKRGQHPETPEFIKRLEQLTKEAAARKKQKEDLSAGATLDGQFPEDDFAAFLKDYEMPQLGLQTGDFPNANIMDDASQNVFKPFYS